MVSIVLHTGTALLGLTFVCNTPFYYIVEGKGKRLDCVVRKVYVVDWVRDGRVGGNEIVLE